MIDKLYPHYSFENPPSVYDEESLTALEMCGRLGKKMNEVISAVNGWEVPKIVHVSPTGDETGELDRAIIQGKLDAGYAVHLSAGEYYLNGPLIFRPGYMLRGDSQLNTVLNCKAGFIDHENIVSVDHVEVRDVRVKGPDSGVGIDISRKVQGIETGGRYAHFMNVYITGYETAVRLGGCWCTNFTHCRIEAKEICVEQRGSCNHIKYDHCMFLGPVNEKTSTAIKISSNDGAENYGISVDHCDFERHKYGIYAYCCVALNVNSVYAESIDTMFHLDSCPNFLCSGGYISYPRIVLQGFKTSSNALFAEACGAIRDVFVRVNSAEKWPFMSTPDEYPVKTENITVKNDGVGVCYKNAQHYSSIYNGVSNATEIRLIIPSIGVSGISEHNRPLDYSVRGKQYKITRAIFVPHTDFTHSGGQAKISVKCWGHNNNAPLLNIVINAGTHKSGDVINSTVSDGIGTDYSKLIFTPNVTLVNTKIETPVSVGNVTGDLIIYISVDDFIL